nr:MAG TPA: hypothetical protein [Inoviridae sp.]
MAILKTRGVIKPLQNQTGGFCPSFFHAARSKAAAKDERRLAGGITED